MVTGSREVGEMGGKRKRNLKTTCKLETFVLFGQHTCALCDLVGHALYSLQFKHCDCRITSPEFYKGKYCAHQFCFWAWRQWCWQPGTGKDERYLKHFWGDVERSPWWSGYDGDRVRARCGGTDSENLVVWGPSHRENKTQKDEGVWVRSLPHWVWDMFTLPTEDAGGL